jgi:hypothetical protein
MHCLCGEKSGNLQSKPWHEIMLTGYFDARSEILTAVLIKLKVFWVVIRSHLDVAVISKDHSAFFFKVSQNMYQSTWQNNPEDFNRVIFSIFI